MNVKDIMTAALRLHKAIQQKGNQILNLKLHADNTAPPIKALNAVNAHYGQSLAAVGIAG